MHCNKCNRDYPYPVMQTYINPKTGIVYHVPHFIKYCPQCGSGLTRRVIEDHVDTNTKEGVELGKTSVDT
jgi:hypothetical protein